MDLEELSNMTEAQLRAKANEHLAPRVTVFPGGSYSTDANLSDAQFFIDEIERRKQERERTENRRIGDRDYKLELWVIGLIGAELVLAVVGLVLGWIEGAKQTKVLNQLSQSSAATATTLTTLQKEQEAALETQRHTLDNIVTMNNALQEQLDENMTGAVQYAGGSGSNGRASTVIFANSGKDILSLWGSKLGSNQPVMKKKPQILEPGGNVTIKVSDQMSKVQEQQGGSLVLPFELYLTRNDGTKYVAKGMILNSYVPHVTTTRKQW